MTKGRVTSAISGLKAHVGAILGLIPTFLAWSHLWHRPYADSRVPMGLILGTSESRTTRSPKWCNLAVKWARKLWYTIMDTLSSKVLCLLGARLRIYPFSVESGFFLILPRRHFLSKMSKITQILYILSGPCMVYSKCLDFLFFSSTKV